MWNKALIMCCVAMFAGTGNIDSVSANEFPERTIFVTVPYPPGGIDPIARLITNGMQASIGQPVVIENRSGANGVIGSELVARSKADGYRLLFGSISTHVTPVFVLKNLPYDPVKDFSPISLVADSTFFLTVRSDLPVNSVEEFIDYAKRNPGKVTYSSSGPGSIFQIITEQFKQLAGIDLVHVPYAGAAPAQEALVRGEVTMLVAGSAASQYVRSGTLKQLAVFDTKRSPQFPNVRPISELFPSYRKIGVWMGFFGPAQLPENVVTKLNGEINKALAIPETQAKLKSIGIDPVGTSPAEMLARLEADLKHVGEVVRLAGIKPGD